MFRLSGISEIQFPKFWTFGESQNPDFQISGLPNLRESGFPEIRKSRFPISGASDVEFSGASDARHRRCPDPSKKHGDQRQKQLLDAEAVALEAGGNVVRYAGLYSKTRGPVLFWLKGGKVTGAWLRLATLMQALFADMYMNSCQILNLSSNVFVWAHF